MVFYPKASGLNNSAAYQVSGKPYVSASIDVNQLGVTSAYPVEFPQVTKFVTIVNTKTGANVPIRFGFSALGVTGSAGPNPPPVGGSDHYFVLNNGESYTGEFRVSKLFLLTDEKGTNGQASVIAGLTGIPAQELANNWSGSAGVG
tara:strand:+ start:171 stop:608 length:438 start_codon:yes stop_codon:yes gene_type:complete